MCGGVLMSHICQRLQTLNWSVAECLELFTHLQAFAGFNLSQNFP